MKRIFQVFLSLGIFFILCINSYGAEKLIVYNTVDEDIAKRCFAEFTKDTKIEVDFSEKLSSGIVVKRLEAEKEKPKTSIWFGAPAINHIDAKKRELTMAYISPNDKYLPLRFKDKEGHWAGLYVGVLGFISNTKLLKEKGFKVPTSWADLLNPQYKGYIRSSNPNTSGTASTLLATICQLMGEDKGFEYLKKLDRNIDQYTKSGTAPVKDAAKGEVPIAISFATVALGLKTKGAPLEITFPSEGTGIEVAAASMIKGGPQEELAKKLYDWAISPKAQAIYAENFFWPLDPKIKVTEGSIPLSMIKLIDFNHQWAGENEKRLVERWNKEIQEPRLKK